MQRRNILQKKNKKSFGGLDRKYYFCHTFLWRGDPGGRERNERRERNEFIEDIEKVRRRALQVEVQFF
jgi:hypothetical protein